jgi:hypothetical protein
VDLASTDSSDYMSRFTLAVLSVQFANILRHQDPREALAVYDHALARLREIKPNASSQLAEADLLAASSYAARWIGRGEDAGGASTMRSCLCAIFTSTRRIKSSR